jgi:hypothetical protein
MPWWLLCARRKREAAYVVYSVEGHGFNRPENKLDFYGRVEEFLAKHLGCPAEPWKKISGSAVELR